MNYSRSNNLKNALIHKKRTETISQRVGSQKLPDIYYSTNTFKPNLKIISDFANVSRIESEKKESFTTTKAENILKLKPIIESKAPEKDPIKDLKLKNSEISDYLKNLKDDKVKKAMDVLKLSLSNEDQQEKSTGFKNNINFGYVGYLLKSDYFEKQEKKEYLNNNHQYPNKKFFFFKPKGGILSRKGSDVAGSTNRLQSKRVSNINEFLYQMDPSVSPNSLGKKIKDFTNFLKNEKDLEKQRNLIDYIQEFIKKEGKQFYNSNMNWKNQNGFIARETQKELVESTAIKKEIFEFYYNLTDFHEKKAEIKELKSGMMNSFKEYDENFKKMIGDLIKYNDHLRKLDNEKKAFTFEG